MTIQDAITATAIEAAQDANMGLLNGCKVDASMFKSMIEVAIVESVKFTTVNAKTQFIDLVVAETKKVSPKLYRYLYPEVHYTANGSVQYK